MNIPEIFVLWHPSCRLGEILARRIHAWLRPGNGLGPQVYYRCLQAPDAPPNGLPPPLQGETRCIIPPGEESPSSRITNLQIVIALIDEHMVSDLAWRHWLTQLRTQGISKRRTIIPVALDPTAYNTPPELRELNFLRPAGLPLNNPDALLAAYEKQPLNQNPSAEERQKAETVELVVRSLLKQLTETLTRLLLPRSKTEVIAPQLDACDLAPPKISIFLSHAKADGRLPAQRLRDYIYSQTQMAAFFDENDIAFSSVFSKVLDTSLDSPTTAAMIAVRSARYAERPWCRREVSLFRKPRRIESESGPDGLSEHWRLHPLIVVEAMDDGSKSLGIPEFGNAPTVRWSPDIPDIEEQIVTRVIRDALLGAYHAALASSISGKSGRLCLFLNWLPDPTTLLHVVRGHPNQELDIIYPGQGLAGAELDVLYEFFPQLWFYSFEEILS